MSKNKHVRSQVLVADRLDDEVTAAAWSKAGLKPNGHLEIGSFYWPAEVRINLQSIKRAVREVRKRPCGCNGKKKHKRNGCVAVRKNALKALSRLKLKGSHKKKIARTVSILAHAKRIDDRSGE